MGICEFIGDSMPRISQLVLLDQDTATDKLTDDVSRAVGTAVNGLIALGRKHQAKTIRLMKAAAGKIIELGTSRKRSHWDQGREP